MGFIVSGVSPIPFAPLYGLPDTELEKRLARRVIAKDSSYPERAELRDATPGEPLLLVNFEHQPADSPFKSRYAIYIREGAEKAVSIEGIPDMLRRRLLSLRAFSDDGMLIDADVVQGHAAEPLIERMLDDEQIAYVHAHSAKPGCYLGRIDRA